MLGIEGIDQELILQAFEEMGYPLAPVRPRPVSAAHPRSAAAAAGAGVVSPRAAQEDYEFMAGVAQFLFRDTEPLAEVESARDVRSHPPRACRGCAAGG